MFSRPRTQPPGRLRAYVVCCGATGEESERILSPSPLSPSVRPSRLSALALEGHA